MDHSDPASPTTIDAQSAKKKLLRRDHFYSLRTGWFAVRNNNRSGKKCDGSQSHFNFTRLFEV
jgi:hypothetical protein